MHERSRREFLAEVGSGMLVACMGTALATEMGIGKALAEPEARRLFFGSLEPLASLLEETPINKLLPAVVARMKAGTDLHQLIAAAALANARTFGGEDYVGFHSFMALVPAYEMSKELPADRKALPVLKVLYRSSNQMQSIGGREHEVLHSFSLDGSGDDTANAESLRNAVRNLETDQAEAMFARMAARSPESAFNDIQPMVEDETDVHRVVLAYRSWAMLGLTGREHAHTLLRQSVRYCIKSEQGRVSRNQKDPGIRAVLPKLLDQYHLNGRGFGSKKADDAWAHKMSETLFLATPDQAADAIAAAIAEGFSADTIGECLSLASNLQVLRDPGRTTAYPGKPIGSVHGDSIGVHGSDSMNAWRNIAAVSNSRNAVASLIVGGYHLARGNGGDPNRLNYKLDAQLEAVKTVPAENLLKETDGAIRENNQARAAALVQRYGELGLPSRPVFDLLLKYATSEDGALHAEKFYRTVTEEFHRTRPAFRWRHVVGLARVTASEYGKRADGFEEACRLLNV